MGDATPEEREPTPSEDCYYVDREGSSSWPATRRFETNSIVTTVGLQMFSLLVYTRVLGREGSGPNDNTWHC